jgi:hydroxymethylpyrimidine pyrophosphatase-like HAD family hydrolase
MIIAVDFDGTIVEHEYPKIGKPILFALETLIKLKAAGHLLILWTVREGEYLDQAVEYCSKNGLQFHAVNQPIVSVGASDVDSRKIVADLYIDDRNIGGLPDWGVTYQLIQANLCFDGYLIPENRARRSTNVFIRFGEFLEKLKAEGYPNT